MTDAHLFDDVKVRSPLRYPGGKTRALSTLLPLIPSGADVCSPFLGGGSVELALVGRGQRVHAYDAYGPLVNFWRAALEEPCNVADMVEDRCMPVTEESFRSAQYRVTINQGGFHWADREINWECAAAFYIANRCSFSGTTASGGFSPEAARDRLNHAALQRLRWFGAPGLDVRHASFERSILEAADRFLFCDPPYLLGKGGSKLYGVKGDMHAGFDHDGLADMLRKRRGGWLLTYNDCPRVRDLYSGCRIDTAEWSYGMNKSKKSREVIIRPQEKLF